MTMMPFAAQDLPIFCGDGWDAIAFAHDRDSAHPRQQKIDSPLRNIPGPRSSATNTAPRSRRAHGSHLALRFESACAARRFLHFASSPRAMALRSRTLPAELCDAVLDYLHDDSNTLHQTALVCRSWVRTSRFHAFAALSLSLSHQLTCSLETTTIPRTPEAAALRALALDLLLSNPHETISVAIRSLEVCDTLAPVRLRPNPTNGIVVTVTLLQLVPRLVLLPCITTLAMTELCYPLLRSIGSTVEHLSLSTGAVCLGGNLPKLLIALPRLRTLTLEGVAGIPLRSSSSHRKIPQCSQLPVSHMQTLTIRHSSVACLPWLTFVSLPQFRALKIEGLVSYEIEYLASFLQDEGIATTLEVLELGFLSTRLDVDDTALAPILEGCAALKMFIMHGVNRDPAPPETTKKSIFMNDDKEAEY
uniref:F-box domain-containing protein n=1 Tax=Mycena chlorophos TaxID=658473 RepID=A0ABQ0M129_MYCCL|nr:predicted protein [Mycena chlorophos]